MTAMTKSRQFALVDEVRKRFFVSALLRMGSQYHPRIGSSSQPTFRRNGTYREFIETEIEKTHNEKEKNYIYMAISLTK